MTKPLAHCKDARANHLLQVELSNQLDLLAERSGATVAIDEMIAAKGRRLRFDQRFLLCALHRQFNAAPILGIRLAVTAARQLRKWLPRRK